MGSISFNVSFRNIGTSNINSTFRRPSSMTEKPRGSHHSEARTKSLVNHRADEMTRRLIPRLLLALLALLALPLAIVASGEPLHIGNFQRTLDADELWVVEFMSPMCGTCQTFAPAWQAFATKRGREVKLGQVNIDTDDGMELAQDLDVLDAGVPSVWAFDKANGEGRVLWKDDTGDVPTADALAQIIFGAFPGAERLANGFLGKTAEADAGEL